MNVYIVRHGLSIDMANSLYQRPDSPLNEIGIKQASVVATRFKNIPIDIIWSSPLRRAVQTSEIINGFVNKELILENLLEEERRPSEVIGKAKSNIRTINIINNLKQNYGKIGYRYSDEDTFDDLRTRASNLLQYLVKQKYKSILLVTHGDISKMLLTNIIYGHEFPASKYFKIQKLFSLNKGSLSLLKYEADQGWKIEYWNDCSHL